MVSYKISILNTLKPILSTDGNFINPDLAIPNRPFFLGQNNDGSVEIVVPTQLARGDLRQVDIQHPDRKAIKKCVYDACPITTKDIKTFVISGAHIRKSGKLDSRTPLFVHIKIPDNTQENGTKIINIKQHNAKFQLRLVQVDDESDESVTPDERKVGDVGGNSNNIRTTGPTIDLLDDQGQEVSPSTFGTPNTGTPSTGTPGSHPFVQDVPAGPRLPRNLFSHPYGYSIPADFPFVRNPGYLPNNMGVSPLNGTGNAPRTGTTTPVVAAPPVPGATTPRARTASPSTTAPPAPSVASVPNPRANDAATPISGKPLSKGRKRKVRVAVAKLLKELGKDGIGAWHVREELDDEDEDYYNDSDEDNNGGGTTA